MLLPPNLLYQLPPRTRDIVRVGHATSSLAYLKRQDTLVATITTIVYIVAIHDSALQRARMPVRTDLPPNTRAAPARARVPERSAGLVAAAGVRQIRVRVGAVAVPPAVHAERAGALAAAADARHRPRRPAGTPLVAPAAVARVGPRVGAVVPGAVPAPARRVVPDARLAGALDAALVVRVARGAALPAVAHVAARVDAAAAAAAG